MKRKQIKFIVVGLTVLALAAGISAGLLAARIASPGAAISQTPDTTPLTIELQLTSDQRDQMRGIWEATRSSVRAAYDDAQRLEKHRDEALVALLNDEQKTKFEKISKDYADQFEQLTHKRDQAFQDAVEQTKKLLSARQRQKYDAILKAHLPAGNEPAFGPAVIDSRVALSPR